MPPASALRRHWSTLVAVALAAFAMGVMMWRILQGVDPLDESFYLAIPARFVMGDRPFVDDLSVAQTAGLLLYPFVKAYFAIVGTTGIYLFVRVLLLIVFACVGWSLYALARRHVPRPAAILLGASCVCYLPYSLPGLGYNTLSISLLAIGLFVSARWLLDEAAHLRTPRRAPWRTPIFWAGFAHAAAAFAYPTQALTVIVALGCLVALARGRRLRALLMYGAGGVAFTLLVSPVLLSAGLAGLREMVHYTSGDAPSNGFAPVVVVARLAGFAKLHPELPLAAGLVLVAAVVVRWLPRPVALAMICLPLAARGSVLVDYLGSVGFVAGFGALAPLLALAVARSAPERRTAAVLGVGVAVPSLVAGLVWSLSSTNLEMAAGVGLWPAALVSALCLALFVDRAFTYSLGGTLAGASPIWARLLPALSLSPAVFLLILLGHIFDGKAYYNDGPRHQMTERMTEGPFWGLSTTPERAQQMRSLAADLQTYRGPPGSALYCNVPAAYLLAERPPLVGAVWIFPAPNRLGRDAALLLDRARPGDLMIRHTEEAALISQILASTSELKIKREGYEVRTYRGFGSSELSPAPEPTRVLGFDEWRSLGTDGGADALAAYGWSWAESWGRWSSSIRAGLVVPRAEVPAGGTTLKLDVIPHLSRRARAQRYRILVGKKVVAEGELRGEGGLVEVSLPVAVAPHPTIFLTLELPDAQPVGDERLLGLGLRRLMIARAAPAP